MPVYRCEIFAPPLFTPPCLIILVRATSPQQARELIDAEIKHIELVLKPGNLVEVPDDTSAISESETIRLLAGPRK